jgi:hypothetical protein
MYSAPALYFGQYDTLKLRKIKKKFIYLHSHASPSKISIPSKTGHRIELPERDRTKGGNLIYD